MDTQKYIIQITEALNNAIDVANKNNEGKVADYIPELANVEQNHTAAAIRLSDGDLITVPSNDQYKFTIQSVSKLVVFIGLMEEFGEDKVYSWIDTEPSGQHFASLYQLDKYGPVPANPLINAGAIALCSHIPGDTIASQVTWVDHWVAKLFGVKLFVNQSVLQSEMKTADRNRSLAYLMRSTKTIKGEIEDILIPYFTLCSYEVDIGQSTYLPMLLANGGLDVNGNRIISETVANQTMAIMATCGMYDESGTYLVKVGMPAKSAISGLITAVATGRGGIAVYSPKVNQKGCSIRGYIILQELSKALEWHFAAPWGYARVDSKLHLNTKYF